MSLNDPLDDHPRLNTVIAWQKYAKIQTNPDRERGGEINVMKLKKVLDFQKPITPISIEHQNQHLGNL